MLATGCDSTDGSRFSDQREYYVLDSGVMVVTANGASSESDMGQVLFRCPAVSNVRNTDVTLFSVKAYSQTPNFELKGDASLVSSLANPVGFSVGDLSFGLLDVYKRCGGTTSEQYVTACPASEGYVIVNSCDGAMSGDRFSCVKIADGSHKLVVTSIRNEDKDCYTGSDIDVTASETKDFCNTFSPREVTAVYRGMTPQASCCQASVTAPTLDFCVKPCGCRTLSFEIVPKDSVETPVSESGDVSSASGEAPVSSPENESRIARGLTADTLKVGIFSNVEGDQDSLESMLRDMVEHDVDLVVSLGNLTESGKASQYTAMYEIINRILTNRDGQRCVLANDAYCCSDVVNNTRRYPFFCNAPVDKIPFLAGLGESEVEGTGASEYRRLFGVSHSLTTVGKVQFMMIDTADATISESEKNWIRSAFEGDSVKTCEIPAASETPSTWQGDTWPVFATMCGSATSCHECIGTEAVCVTPDGSYGSADVSSKNCVCLPKSAKYCRGNRACIDDVDNSHNASGLSAKVNTTGTCGCVKDSDCGKGQSCVDHQCRLPMRFVFSYTPLFDEFGSRNNAFISRTEAASLLSTFVKAEASAVFSGRVLDYGHYKKAGIDFYATGGGGADMASFEKYGHHWLMLTIPHAYTAPEDYQVDVMTY